MRCHPIALLALCCAPALAEPPASSAQALEENLQPLVKFHSSFAYFVTASARVRISFTFHGRPSVFVTLLMRGSQ